MTDTRDYKTYIELLTKMNEITISLTDMKNDIKDIQEIKVDIKEIKKEIIKINEKNIKEIQTINLELAKKVNKSFFKPIITSICLIVVGYFGLDQSKFMKLFSFLGLK